MCRICFLNSISQQYYKNMLDVVFEDILNVIYNNKIIYQFFLKLRYKNQTATILIFSCNGFYS